MTNEQKQLLLKDLCARLPYNVIICCTDSNINYKFFLTTDTLHELLHDIAYYDYKPYLRPMSSMTEEEAKGIGEFLSGNFYVNIIDWLNAHHFDYRGLIPMGLALEAKKGMYKNE